MTKCVVPAAWARISAHRLRGREERRTLIVLWGLLDFSGGALSVAVFCAGWALSHAVAVIYCWIRAPPGVVLREELCWGTLFSAVIYCWVRAPSGAVLREELGLRTLFSAIIYCWVRTPPGAVLREELCLCTLFSAVIYWVWAQPVAVLREELYWCTLFTLVFCTGLALPRAAVLAVFWSERGR